jgi:threonine dehydrogenase-like Zn-dependent dehydrogenase
VVTGTTAVVVGDGAVGLCGVLAAARLGAGRIIALGHHADRLEIARRFGATDLVAARGEEAVAAVKELTGGEGAPSVLECVGTQGAMEVAFGAARAGGIVGFVGVPAGVSAVPIEEMFERNVSLRGGVAPARAYLPELLADVLAGTLDASPVFDLDVSLAEVARGYAAMDARTATKVLVRP